MAQADWVPQSARMAKNACRVPRGGKSGELTESQLRVLGPLREKVRDDCTSLGVLKACGRLARAAGYPVHPRSTAPPSALVEKEPEIFVPAPPGRGGGLRGILTKLCPYHKSQRRTECSALLYLFSILPLPDGERGGHLPFPPGVGVRLDPAAFPAASRPLRLHSVSSSIPSHPPLHMLLSRAPKSSGWQT